MQHQKSVYHIILNFSLSRNGKRNASHKVMYRPIMTYLRNQNLRRWRIEDTPFAICRCRWIVLVPCSWISNTLEVFGSNRGKAISLKEKVLQNNIVTPHRLRVMGHTWPFTRPVGPSHPTNGVLIFEGLESLFTDPAITIWHFSFVLTYTVLRITSQ